MFGLGLGLGLRQRGRFSPKLLFAKGEAGAWYDPADMASMFQDSAGTIAAIVDAPVGSILDKSGRGNHAVQTVAAARPMLRMDGGGRLYLEFDGVDDCLRKAFPLAQPWERMSAVRQIGWTNNRRLFSGVSTSAGDLRQGGVAPQLVLSSGGSGFGGNGPEVGANGVIFERHAGTDSRLAVNNEAPAAGDGGSSPADGISIAEIGTGTGLARAANMRLYGLCMIGRVLSDGEAQRLRRFMAARAGVAL